MAGDRLSRGQVVAAAAAVLLLIFMFLPWFTTPTVEAVLPSGEPVDLSGVDTSIDTGGHDLNGWEGENPLDVYLALTILITLGGVALAARGRGGAATLMPLSAVTFVLGAIGTLLVLYQVFDVPGGFERKYGLFLGLIAVAGIAVGGWLSMQEEGSPGGALLTDRPLLGVWVGALSGAGLLAATFLGWYGSGSSEASANAWEAFTIVDVVCAAAAIAALGVAVVTLTGLSVSYPVAGNAVSCGAGALAFILVLYRLLDPPLDGDVTRELGIWLGLITSAGIALGGYLGMQEHST